MWKLVLLSMASLLIACGGGGGGDSVGSVTVEERNSDNNSFSSAQLVTLNNVVGGDLEEDVDVLDFYKFQLAGQANVTLRLSGPSDADFDLDLYSSNGILLAASLVEGSSEEIKITLAAGIYFVGVYSYEEKGSGDYSLSMQSGEILAGTDNLSVYTDLTSVCVQFNDLTQELASVIVDKNSEYEYGICPDNYSYRCDREQDGLNIATYYTPSYSMTVAESTCNDLEGDFYNL